MQQISDKELAIRRYVFLGTIAVIAVSLFVVAAKK